MEDKNVELLATLFNKKSDEIKEAIKSEEKLAGLINEYKESHKIFTSEELVQKIDNVKRETIDLLGKDGKPLPSHIYNLAKGNAFEKKEKQIAEVYGIEKWDGIDDLISQAFEKKLKDSGKATNEKDAEKDKLIKDLKEQVLNADTEKNTAIAEEKGKYDKELIEREINSVVLAVPINPEDEEKLTNQRRVLKTMFKDVYSFERKDGIIVISKDGEPIVNKVGDPVSINEVINEFAPQWVDLKTVPKGGRGGGFTNISGEKVSNLKNMKELIEYANSKDIHEGTAKFLELMQEAEKNPDFNMQ